VNTAYDYYMTNNRLKSIITTSPTQGELLNKAYTYDNVGNVGSITDSRSQDLTYYESSLALTYDPSSTPNAGPHAVTSTTSGRAFVYDGNGNITADGIRTISYNYDNKPQSINGSDVSFIYDGSGARTKKITSSGIKIYLDKFYECIGGVCGKYIYAGNDRIALVTPTQTIYYHPDHLGSTSVVTDATKNKTEDIDYYPFGKSKSDSGTSAMNHKFTSQELDAETGLYNYGARLYDPEFGRFICPDTIVPDPSNPQSLNRYSYALNNPVKYTDPTGHKSFWAGLVDLFTTGSWDGEPSRRGIYGGVHYSQSGNVENVDGDPNRSDELDQAVLGFS
jgi:RHS repeat-associated protein